jgi:hypothetical protein
LAAAVEMVFVRWQRALAADPLLHLRLFANLTAAAAFRHVRPSGDAAQAEEPAAKADAALAGGKASG